MEKEIKDKELRKEVEIINFICVTYSELINQHEELEDSEVLRYVYLAGVIVSLMKSADSSSILTGESGERITEYFLNKYKLD